MSKRRTWTPGEVTHDAHCMDCGAWTERAKDGTLVIRHLPGLGCQPKGSN